MKEQREFVAQTGKQGAIEFYIEIERMLRENIGQTFSKEAEDKVRLQLEEELKDGLYTI